MITLAYITKLDLITHKINIGTEKINCLLLEIYSIVSAKFSLQNNLKKV